MLRTPGVASNHFINCPLSNGSIISANRNTIKQILAARWFDRGKPVAASVGSVAASLREELLDPTLGRLLSFRTISRMLHALLFVILAFRDFEAGGNAPSS
jgi:hypothetical protein